MTDWDEKKSRALIGRALAASKADATVVRLSASAGGATRFANSEITQNVARSDATLSVEAAFDNKIGRCRTNRLDDEAIADCVRRAEAIARVAPPDPEYMPPVEPAACPSVDLRRESTARTSPADRAAAIRKAVAVAEGESMTGAGAFSTADRATAVGNSAGVFVHQRETVASMTFSATAPDSVGWAQGHSREVGEIDPEAIARRAVEKARAGRSPRDLPAGRYEVVLEPAAVEEFLLFFSWYQMDAKASDEGRTFLANKKGKTLVGANIDLFSDPVHPGCPARPFTNEGMTLRRVDWIREGVLTDLMYSRFWAKKQGVEPTGWPTTLILKGGRTPVEEMIRSVRRGLLVTRFWYIRAVEPIRDLFTGMTRDGTFLIENGEIAHPVKNLRFNESPVHFLSNVDLLGEPAAAAGEVWTLMPPVKAHDFNFTSTTQF